MARRPARCYRYCKSTFEIGIFEEEGRIGPRANHCCRQALSQVEVQPWCSRPKDQDFWFGTKESRCRWVPTLYPLGVQRVWATFIRSPGSRSCLLQQIPSPCRRKGQLPHPCPYVHFRFSLRIATTDILTYILRCPPIPCHPYQQNVVMCWSG